jgi:hypothetical protein
MAESSRQKWVEEPDVLSEEQFLRRQQRGKPTVCSLSGKAIPLDLPSDKLGLTFHWETGEPVICLAANSEINRYLTDVWISGSA